MRSNFEVAGGSLSLHVSMAVEPVLASSLASPACGYVREASTLHFHRWMAALFATLFLPLLAQ